MLEPSLALRTELVARLKNNAAITAIFGNKIFIDVPDFGVNLSSYLPAILFEGADVKINRGQGCYTEYTISQQITVMIADKKFASLNAAAWAVYECLQGAKIEGFEVGKFESFVSVIDYKLQEFQINNINYSTNDVGKPEFASISCGAMLTN